MRLPIICITLLALLGGGIAHAADRGLSEPTAPNTPSAKRMVRDRQMMMLSAFAHYMEQQLGLHLTTPLGRAVTLELAPRPDAFSPSADLVSLRRDLAAVDGPQGTFSNPLSAVLSATPDRVRLTLRMRW